MWAMYFRLKVGGLTHAGNDTGDPLVYGAVLNQAAASCVVLFFSFAVASISKHNELNLHTPQSVNWTC